MHRQIKMRSQSLASAVQKVAQVLADFDFAHILTELDKLKPDLVIIDSIQTLYACEAGCHTRYCRSAESFCCHERKHKLGQRK